MADTIDVTMPDGTVVEGVPSTVTKAELAQKYAAHLGNQISTHQQTLNQLKQAVSQYPASFQNSPEAILALGPQPPDLTQSGLVQNLWKPITSGLLSPETMAGGGENLQRLREEAEARVNSGKSPGLSGMGASAANVASGLTSPANIALMAAGWASGVPSLAPAAKAVEVGVAPAIAAQGAGNVIQAGFQNTPQAWEQRLTGAAQVAGGVAGVKAGEIPKPVRSAISEGAGAAGEFIGQNALKVAKVTPIAKMFIDGPPEDLMTRAVKPGKNNVDWQANVKSALPNMKAAEETLGHPIQGVDDALQAAGIAKKGLWAQYAPKLQAADAAGGSIDGNVVADAMMNSIDKRTQIQNPELVARVQKIADTYRHPIPVAEAEDFLQSANNDLHNYYAKNKVGRQVAEGDPTISSTVAEGDTLRAQLYSKLDEITGSGAADFKKQYGSLSNVQQELQGRKNVAARQQPVSLSEQLSAAHAYGKIAKGMLTFSPGDIASGAEQVAVAKWLKERQTTDAMITRAFEATKSSPPQPFALTAPSAATPPQQPMLPGSTVPLEKNFGPQGRRDASFFPRIPEGWMRDPITGRIVRKP